MADTEQVTPEQASEQPERASEQPERASEQPERASEQTAPAGGSSDDRATAEQTSLEARAGERPASTKAADHAGAGGCGPDAGGTAVSADAEKAEAEQVLRGDVDELVATAAKRDEYLALAQRTQADFENYRKRVARDLASAQERGVTKLARELLPALDNLDRALEAAESDDPLLEGVRLVRAELSAALGRVGIESFTPGGERFDPEQHEAIAQQPFEGVDSGKVAEVYQQGYRCNGTIIRPARVVVAA